MTNLELAAVQLRQGTSVTLEILGSRGEAVVNTVRKKRVSLSLAKDHGSCRTGAELALLEWRFRSWDAWVSANWWMAEWAGVPTLSRCPPLSNEGLSYNINK